MHSQQFQFSQLTYLPITLKTIQYKIVVQVLISDTLHVYKLTCRTHGIHVLVFRLSWNSISSLSSLLHKFLGLSLPSQLLYHLQSWVFYCTTVPTYTCHHPSLSFPSCLMPLFLLANIS